MNMGKYLALVFTWCLVACSGFPTTHSDAAKNNRATYQSDLKDCAQSYPETPDGVYLRRRIGCMNLKGWQ
jgi:hypothetical protein